MECCYQPYERRVQFTVCEVRAGAHTRSGTVGVVRGAACALEVIEVAVDREFFGVFEV